MPSDSNTPKTPPLLTEFITVCVNKADSVCAAPLGSTPCATNAYDRALAPSIALAARNSDRFDARNPAAIRGTVSRSALRVCRVSYVISTSPATMTSST
ncbi:hypothetical protein ACWEIJ_36115 [Lentzea sp. NPDC004789]